MDEPLRNTEEIMKYSGLGKKALQDAIDWTNFPCFMISGKRMSSKRAIDEWFFQMAINRVKIGAEIVPEEEKE